MADPFAAAFGGDASSSEESSGSGESLTSAEQRAAAAAARLKDFGDAATDAATTTAAPAPRALPSAADVFDAVDGPPDFLCPEATRKITQSATHLREPPPPPTDGEPAAGPRSKKGEGFDVALLAPKGKRAEAGGGDKRGGGAAVIEGKAKRYKQDGDEAGGGGAAAPGTYSAAAIALLGGGDVPAASKKAPAAAGDARATTKPSRAMPVSDFLDRGAGGALLPRSQQDRRDKEKRKRELGQSAHATWKSEAEMALRQQYD